MSYQSVEIHLLKLLGREARRNLRTQIGKPDAMTKVPTTPVVKEGRPLTPQTQQQRHYAGPRVTVRYAGTVSLKCVAGAN